MTTVGCRTLEDLDKISESAVDDKLIPAIEGLGQPTFQAFRPKKLIAAVVQKSALSWNKKKRGIAEDEDTPLLVAGLRVDELLFIYPLAGAASTKTEAARSFVLGSPQD